jgi:hypothetical protein
MGALNQEKKIKIIEFLSYFEPDNLFENNEKINIMDLIRIQDAQEGKAKKKA